MFSLTKSNNRVEMCEEVNSTSQYCVESGLVQHLLTLLQQSLRRQSALAFSLFGVVLAHGDLRNNKLSQLTVNLWHLSHKHGHCETRISVSSRDTSCLKDHWSRTK